MTRAGVLFDIDGTLVDNTYVHTLAWARAFAEVGEQPSMAAIHRRVGMAADGLVEAILGRAVPELSDGHARHIEALEGDMHAFPGAGDLLRGVAARDLVVVLATSAQPHEVEARLRLVDADDVITHVTNAGDADEGKPAPDIFLAAMAAAGLAPDRALAVGDSVWDVQAAARAGLRCLGVESGGFSEAELLEAGAVAVYRDAADLHARLDESPIAALAAAPA